MNNLLWRYTDASFRQTVRMDKASFHVQLISPYEVFHKITRNRHMQYYAISAVSWAAQNQFSQGKFTQPAHEV